MYNRNDNRNSSNNHNHLLLWGDLVVREQDVVGDRLSVVGAQVVDLGLHEHEVLALQHRFLLLELRIGPAPLVETIPHSLGRLGI